MLIDAGLSCRETEKRMARMGLSIKTVGAIFISHEHSDHIKGVTVLSKKHNLPVYVTEPTYKFGRLHVEPRLARSFSADMSVTVNNITVTPFVKHHDAGDPHGFVVEGNGVIVGVFTDIGQVCDNLSRHFRGCHAAFLEANYDADMLEQGRYPIHLKQRIRGGKGHLSNHEALELFNTHRPAHMSHLFLSHLSAENNDPGLVNELFTEHAGDVQVVVASRYRETEVFHIRRHDEGVYDPAPMMAGRQASLF